MEVILLGNNIAGGGNYSYLGNARFRYGPVCILWRLSATVSVMCNYTGSNVKKVVDVTGNSDIGVGGKLLAKILMGEKDPEKQEIVKPPRVMQNKQNLSASSADTTPLPVMWGRSV